MTLFFWRLHITEAAHIFKTGLPFIRIRFLFFISFLLSIRFVHTENYTYKRL